MRVRTWAAAGLAALVGWAAAADLARAQENPNPEQMRKMYDDALQQLKAAQERKNQLAAENEKLGKQVEAMQKDLAAAHGRVEELKRADAEHAERTFFLRSHYAAWQQFARLNPETAGRWRAFLGSDFLVNPREPGWLIDRDWPTGPVIPPATRPAGTRPATTQPSGAEPATVPSATRPAMPPATQPTTHPAAAPDMPTTGPGPGPGTVPAAPATVPAGTVPPGVVPPPTSPVSPPPAATQPAATRPA